jgi:hypothetical protein
MLFGLLVLAGIVVSYADLVLDVSWANSLHKVILGAALVTRLISASRPAPVGVISGTTTGGRTLLPGLRRFGARCLDAMPPFPLVALLGAYLLLAALLAVWLDPPWNLLLALCAPLAWVTYSWLRRLPCSIDLKAGWGQIGHFSWWFVSGQDWKWVLEVWPRDDRSTALDWSSISDRFRSDGSGAGSSISATRTAGFCIGSQGRMSAGGPARSDETGSLRDPRA